MANKPSQELRRQKTRQQVLDDNLEFDFAGPQSSKPQLKLPLADQLSQFTEFGKPTVILPVHASRSDGRTISVPAYVNEFWTAKQRAANSLHEISYRACFKPQLPRFFIERLTEPGDVVYDPFMGRGTTVLEAALLNRIPCGCDINPLSVFLIQPRLCPPAISQVHNRLQQINLQNHDEFPEDLLVFYHPDTLREICALKKYLVQRQAAGSIDSVDRWIWMVALNRLTGHSPGFFSVYTMPPNQAVSITAQRKINADRNQSPPKRNVPELIYRKTRHLLADCGEPARQAIARASRHAVLLTAPSDATPSIQSQTVSLVVTSPPFLDVVNYAVDNWLRCWFIGIESASIAMTVPRKLEDWQTAMAAVFRELSRVLRPGGHVAFEVGEVRRGKITLEEAVLPCGVQAGLEPLLVMINDQKFTKTANCWGVGNNSKGTNTNRIVVFRKPV